MTAPGRLAGTKVLVADDDATLVGTLTWILKEQGCQVVAVPDGQNLLERSIEQSGLAQIHTVGTGSLMLAESQFAFQRHDDDK